MANLKTIDRGTRTLKSINNFARLQIDFFQIVFCLGFVHGFPHSFARLFRRGGESFGLVPTKDSEFDSERRMEEGFEEEELEEGDEEEEEGQDKRMQMKAEVHQRRECVINRRLKILRRIDTHMHL